MKAIRMFYRRVNHNSTPSKRQKCEASLAHTLRLAGGQSNGLQWREELADENIIYLNGKYHQLSNFSDDEKQTLLYDIAPTLPVHNKKKHQENRRKYKLKIKKAIESENRKGNIEAAEFMRQIIRYANNKHISYSKLDNFAALDSTRKRQRAKMLQTYIESHNKLVNKVAYENSVYVQEGLFKFPLQWGITTDIVSKKMYIDVVKDFLTKHFGDYHLDCIVCHHDERELDEDVGAHSHYFLNGMNIVTGQYDLHKTQVSVVNQYIIDNGELVDRLPSDGKLNLKQAKVFGEYFQRMFYQHVNTQLLIPLGLKATFAEETEQKSEKRKRINKEAKLPKALRKYNLNSRSNELAKKRLDKLQQKISAEHDELKALDNNLEQQQAALKLNFKQIKEAKYLLKHYATQAQIANEDLKLQEARLIELTEQMETLDMKGGNAIADICRKIYLVSALRDRGLDAKAQEFIEQILIEFSSLEPSLLNNVCGAAARAINEEALISGLKVSEIFEEPVIK